ncbi:MAG: GNAT family N-acetyltransferase [Actinomycetota bacterium]
MIIRPETSADHEVVGRVVTSAFGHANEARLVELIRDSPHYISELALVAQENGIVVGQALFSYVGLDGDSPMSILGLAPVAVVPSRQGRGIGSALIRAGLDRANARKEPLVVVLGHPGYYPRFGFELASRHGIEPPSRDIPDSAFMVKLLSGYCDRYRGRVVYPPAFDVT